MSLAGLINSASAVYGLANVATYLSTGNVFAGFGGYRPTSWGRSLSSSMLLMVPNIGGIFFDAVFNYEEDRGVTYTSHPVQNGANISDHGFINPVTCTMDVAVSNAMASRQPGGWYGSFSGNKAQDAVNAVLALMHTKQPVKVIAPKSILTNMVIESVSRHEDVSTKDVARMSITMKQLLIVDVATEKASARQWSTAGAANRGAVEPVEERGSTLYEWGM